MKSRCRELLMLALPCGLATSVAQPVFDPASLMLSVPSITAGAEIYRNLQARLDADGRLTIVALQEPSAASPDRVPPSGLNAGQCFGVGGNQLLSCSSADALGASGSAKQDGMREAALSFDSVARPSGGHFDRSECVLDKVTGLIWEGKTADGSARDWRSTFTNFADRRAGDASAYLDAVNTQRLCGKSDWRLPSLLELHGLIDFGRTSRPMQVPGSFSYDDDVRVSLIYWTHTPGPNSTFRTVGFGGAYSAVQSAANFAPRGSQKLVRLVSGPPASSAQFVLSADGSEVIDTKYRLAWRRCLEGVAWIPMTCPGSPGACGYCSGNARAFSHAEAFTHARQLTAWRLPTAKELLTTVDTGRSQPSANEALFPDVWMQGFPWIWSSTAVVSDPRSAWTAYFYDGTVDPMNRNARVAVRLVREVK